MLTITKTHQRFIPTRTVKILQEQEDRGLQPTKLLDNQDVS